MKEKSYYILIEYSEINVYISIMNMFVTIIIGVFIGIANIIPGVSGGTIAVVFNIYDKFVNAISLNLKKLKENWRFIIPLLLGMALGVVLFSKIIQVLYDKFPVQTNYLFTGLIIGSIPMLYKYMTESKSEKKDKKNITKTAIFSVIGIIIGIALIILFNVLQAKYGGKEDLNFSLPEWTLPLAIKIFVAGIVGAVAMIVPGISGSLLMLIMGVYPIVVSAIPALLTPSTFMHALILLLPNGIGVVTGLVLGAKLISYLLKKCQTVTYAVILGLLIGSAVVLCPYAEGFTSFVKAISSIICFACGVAMAYFSSKFTGNESEKKSSDEVIENK